VLHLERNALTGLAGLPPMPALRCLYVGHNALTSLAGLPAPDSLPCLQVLDARQAKERYPSYRCGECGYQTLP
jgi:hypothetical protein